MTGERLFVDTTFIQALLNQADQFHQRAIQFAPRLRSAAEVWFTQAILIEVGNALSALNRSAAVQFIEQAYRTPNVRVIPVDTALLRRATSLYRDRADKTWGLTDRISFVVMSDQQLNDAVTADEHFRQAGYRALLLEESAA